MAKRKRASLKDKSPETLGLTRKKGKGIDLLFGGAVDSETDEDQPDAAETSSSATGVSNIPQEADTSSNTGLVDELGLPVAMEHPPDDLILASSPVETIAGDEEKDAVDPALSPFAMPTAESVDEDLSDATDLSGILQESMTEENDSTNVEEEILSSPEEKTDLTDMVEDASSDSGDPNDLSGLVTETTSAGADAANSATDLSGLAAEEAATGTVPTSSPPSTNPPSTAAPEQPATDPGAAYTPPPAYPEPFTIERPPQGLINAVGAFAENVPITPQTFRPQDELGEVADHRIDVSEYQPAVEDAELARRVIEYVGEERRDKLREEIEQLHNDTSEALSGNRRDMAFALDTLRQAHNIILENPREYDEAFYRVAIVKSMLDRKSNLLKWSYTWGLFVFVYGLLWLVACGLGLSVVNESQLQGDSLANAISQAWVSGLAGGIGGAVVIWWTLYYRVSVKQDFDRQYLMWYLVKPLLGFVLGLVMYFLLIVVTSFAQTEALSTGFDSITGIAISLIFGFIAGFRQDQVYDWIYVLMKSISPEVPEEAQSKTSLVPPDFVEEQQFKIQ